MRHRRQASLLAGVLMLTLGIGIAGQGGYIHVKAWAAQILLDRAWQRTLAGETPARPWPWADHWPVARLILPAQDAERYVLSEASGRALAFGPGHIPRSAAPGAPGVSVIAGHRDTHFRILRQVAPGDPIVIETADGRTHRFLVTAKQVLRTPALRFDDSAAAPVLMLTTCWPFDAVVAGGPERYVLTARAIQS